MAHARQATRTLADLHDAADAGGLDTEALAQATVLVDDLVAQQGRRCDPRRLRNDLDDLDDLAARTGSGHLAQRPNPDSGSQPGMDTAMVEAAPEATTSARRPDS